MSKIIVMAGTGFDTMGGISSVVKVYRDAGLFQRYPIVYLATHCDGGAAAKLGAALRAYGRYLLMLLSFKVGLLHVHVASRASFWRKMPLFLLAFLFRIPTILHLHGAEFVIFYEQESGPLRRRLIRAVFNRARRVVVLSDMWKQWVESIGVRAPVQAIYNPVMLPPATEWSARASGQLLFLGRLGKRKGTYDLVDALARLPAAPEALLGGDGETAQTTDYARQRGLGDKVRMLGWVGPEQKAGLLASATIYVLPSYNEGLPMSLLEAMAAGMPVLSTTVGGIPEAVSDGVEGFLVQAGDIDALSARLEQLLADPALAQRMGAAARRKVETTFASGAVLPRIEQLYQELGFARA